MVDSSNNANIIEVEVFENERFLPISGWKGSNMMMHPNFSDATGSVNLLCLREASEPPILNYEWMDNWTIDKTFTICDEEGWSYAMSYNNLVLNVVANTSSAVPNQAQNSRRRRWVRSARISRDVNEQTNPNATVSCFDSTNGDENLKPSPVTPNRVISTGIHEIVSSGTLPALAEMLKSNSSAVKWKDAQGLTSLHHACEAGAQEKVALLIQHKADVDATNDTKIRALHRASTAGHVDIVIMLLDHGANINKSNSGGLTPLHCAAQNGHALVVQALLSFGSVKIAKVDHMHHRSALHLAANEGHTRVVEFLLADGADINATDKEGMTPLHFACSQGLGDVAECLVKHGANLKASSTSSSSSATLPGSRSLMRAMAKAVTSSATPSPSPLAQVLCVEASVSSCHIMSMIAVVLIYLSKHLLRFVLNT